MKTLDEIFSKRKSLDDIFNQEPQFSDEAKAQVQANNEAYALRQEENRPWFDKNPAGRLGVAIAQGISNSALNPAGYVARGMGIDTKPLKPENAIEKGAELAGEYGFDAAALGGIGKIAQGAGYLGKGQTLRSKVAQEVLAPENTTALLSKFVAPAVGGGLVEGITDPRNPFERTLANVAGAGIGGGLAGGFGRTRTSTKGGLKEALPNDKANATLSKGVRADKDVARQISKDAPAVYNELNAEMSEALDKATGRKLNIKNALESQQERYNDYIKGNANKEVISEINRELPPKVGYGQDAPTIEQLTEGLSDFQKKVFEDVLKEGADKVTNPKGSLRAVHRALEVLNKRIDNTINENPLRPRSMQDADVRDLMQVKNRLNQALEFGGIKPYDAGISKAKGLQANYEQGFNFKPSETKFENLGLKTARDKRAFLQGRMTKIQDNVLSDGGTNLATAVKKDENTLRKLMPKSKFDELMNKANSLEEQFKRLKSIEGQADREIVKDIERGGSPMRENIESKGSIIGRGLDILSNAINRSKNRNLANAYLNPEIDEIRQMGGIVGALKGSGSSTLRQALIDAINK